MKGIITKLKWCDGKVVSIAGSSTSALRWEIGKKMPVRCSATNDGLVWSYWEKDGIVASDCSLLWLESDVWDMPMKKLFVDHVVGEKCGFVIVGEKEVVDSIIVGAPLTIREFALMVVSDYDKIMLESAIVIGDDGERAVFAIEEGAMINVWFKRMVDQTAWNEELLNMAKGDLKNANM